VGPETSDTTYVDSTIGVDQPDYGISRETPYRTITYALAQETTKGTIEIANGIYDVSNGEQFPIVVRSGTKLIGRSIVGGLSEYALIKGTGVYESSHVNGTSEVAVVLEGTAGIRNLVINSENGVAVWCEDTMIDAVMLNNGLINSKIGLTLVGNSKITIKDNIVKDNQQSGIEIFDNGAPLLLNNEISNNSVGVLVNDNASPSFGDSSGGGGNIIIGNTLCDLLHSGLETFSTIGTRWDLDEFNFSISSTCNVGNEITVDNTGTVIYQYIPPEDSLLFSNKDRIRLDQPGFGETIFTQEPNFVWSDSSAYITMVTVWDQPPIVTLEGISNTDSLYWIWHSGLGTGGSGFVQFSDGVSLVGGDISNPTPPKLLEKGRSYFWAVWGWDENGKEITASSSLSYFIVSN